MTPAQTRTVRSCKQLEQKLRRQNDAPPALVWATFFGPHGRCPEKSQPDASSFKETLSAYWAYVYYDIFASSGLPGGVTQNADLLQKLGLHAFAGEEQVKQRFRELAKTCHPDLGGDPAQFIELMDTYKALLGR